MEMPFVGRAGRGEPDGRLDAHDSQTVRLGGYAECPVVGSHIDLSPGRVLPKQRGREVYGVERAELGRHGLRGAIEDEAIDLDELQGIEQCEHDGAASGHFEIREPCAQSQAIQGAEAFGGDEGA